MAMVSNKFLAALAVELGFHRHLRCAGSVVEDLNRKFVVELEELKQKANGRRDYWTAAENPPKVKPTHQTFGQELYAKTALVPC